jgi:hypothetical protein
METISNDLHRSPDQIQQMHDVRIAARKLCSCRLRFLRCALVESGSVHGPAEKPHPNPQRLGGLNDSEFAVPGSWVIRANMRCEFFVTLRLEVAHHFIEGSAAGRSRRLEPPATFGAAKPSKTLLLDPYQRPHGLEF